MTPPKIFIIGGTGAQGIPVVRGLVHDGKYAAHVLTRDPNSRRAKELAALSPNVTIVQGSFTSETDLRAGFTGAWGAFVNIDGFATGEAMETWWTIRSYEIALECGVQFYVHGNIDYIHKLSGYNPLYRCGHLDGKGRMGEWILLQRAAAAAKQTPNTTGMKSALFTTGPYMEMSLDPNTPMGPTIEHDDETGSEILTWRLPLTASGAVPHTALDDCAHYVRWLFDNPDRADGMNLGSAISLVHYDEIAAAFTRVTGRKARFIDVDLDTYWGTHPWAKSVADLAAGYTAPASAGTGEMTMRENFTGFWRAWQVSGENKGLVTRDFGLMEEIYPGRIKSAEEFFKREDDRARREGKGGLWEVVVEGRPVLKITEDGVRGRRIAEE